MSKYIFFDLDGTLTDSSEGITKCVHMTLVHYGITEYEPDQLRTFIGPPLRVTFPAYGVPESEVENAITLFRSRYLTVGKFENKPYEGIRELLAVLKEEGNHLFVATSKPEKTAKEILDKFDLAKYFEEICGATMDGKIDSKEDVIRYLLSKIDNSTETVMVGDTKYDVIGANAFHIPTVGVAWGFGTEEEMREAGAKAIVETMEELHTILSQ